MSGFHHSHSNSSNGGGFDNSNNDSSFAHPSYTVKCTDLPQFEALQNAAAEFLNDEKLHLRYLCNDTARCSGLTASLASYTTTVVVTPPAAQPTTGNNNNNNAALPPPAVNVLPTPLIRKIILDYSRQQVTGETMELLFDLADAVQLADRREAFRTGLHNINTTEDKPVLHHLLRVPPPLNSALGTTSAGGGLLSSKPQVVHRQASVNNAGRPTINAPGNPETNNYNNGSSSYGSSRNAPVVEQIHATRQLIATFSAKVRDGSNTLKTTAATFLGCTGQPLTDTIVVSAGMEHLGTRFVHRALQAHPGAAQASQGRRLHFLSNTDPVDTYFTTRGLNPATTLVVVILLDSVDVSASKSSIDRDMGLLNFNSIRHWLVSNLLMSSSSLGGNANDHPNAPPLTELKILERHMVAVSSLHDETFPPRKLGIPKANVFSVGDWIIGRFSVCSAVGVLPLSLQYGYDVVSEFLDGAHDMDEHFFNAPLRDNIPVLLGLLGVWNSTFLGYTARSILPFSEALDALPAYIQLVDMESNGKRVAMDGVELYYQAGEMDFGEVAGNSHHPFFQLMHQGRVVPADFIGFMESPRPLDLPGSTVSSHDEFMSNFFAQPDALAYGKSLVDLIQEGVPDGLRQHMVFPGNRPSSSLLITRLDPFSIGQLLALYEHRTAVQGFLWGINSFDQFGLEMGKLLAKYIRMQLAASRKTGATVQGFNQSTSSLLEAYLNHGKQGK